MTRDDVIRMAREAGLCTWIKVPEEKSEKLERFAALVLEADDGPWKASVIDQLIIAHILTAEHENDPLKAVQDLLAYHADIAVDPRVSGAAARLVEQAKAEEREARTKPAATAEDPLGAYVTQALNAEVISPDAGGAISALFHENRIHAEFLKRDDIAGLAPEKQAALWLKHKEGVAAFANLLSGTTLYGLKSEKKK